MYSFGGIVVDASCGVWWMGGMELGNGDGFFPSAERGSRGGEPSVSVGLVSFFLGVAAWWRGI